MYDGLFLLCCPLFLSLVRCQRLFPLGPQRWVLSTAAKYASQPVSVVAPRTNPGVAGDLYLTGLMPAKNYGLFARFPTVVDPSDDKPFVVQFESRLQDGLECGGAYVKVFLASAVNDADGEALKSVDVADPKHYAIMFGPDKCGSTNKIHFIFRHKNARTGEWEEKHLANAPHMGTVDRLSNLYTLVIRPDNSFTIKINNDVAKSGSLLEDFKPAVNPPALIDDPTDSKPLDWVDEPKMADPTASKPEDWDESAPEYVEDADATKPVTWLDDEPDYVPDPNAVKPAEWDEDEDGDYEAPLIRNPKCEAAPGCGPWKRPMKKNPNYRGKWTAPLIDNPNYKGPWKARQIPNPNYFEDLHPHRLQPMGAIAIDIWTMSGNVAYDNILVGRDEQAASDLAEATWRAKFDAQKSAIENERESEKASRRSKKWDEGGIGGKLEVLADMTTDFIGKNMIVSVIAISAIIIASAFLCCGSLFSMEPEAPETVAPTATTSEGLRVKRVRRKTSPSASESARSDSPAAGSAEDDAGDDEEPADKASDSDGDSAPAAAATAATKTANESSANAATEDEDDHAGDRKAPPASTTRRRARAPKD